MGAGWLSVATRISRGINRLFTILSGALAVAIVLIVLQDVIRRYAFNDPSVWALDVSSFLLVYLFFFALAPALQSGSHVTVDLFNDILPRAIRRHVVILGYILIIVFGCVFFWQLFRATYDAFVDNELFPTATPVRIKHVWLIGPIGAAQFILTAAVQLATTVAENRAVDARRPAA